MIKEQSNQFSLRLMCRLLSVLANRYYAWRDRKPSRREEENRQLSIKIKFIFDDEKSRAGALRITKRLNNEGTPDRVAKIMCSHGWRARAAKKLKATRNSNHSFLVAPNLLQQNFLAHRPNEKWVGDITYVWTEEGWLYLAVVMDLYSRKVVGWALSERMTKQLVIDAMNMIEIYYNRKRLHSMIGHKSPVLFEVKKVASKVSIFPGRDHCESN